MNLLYIFYLKFRLCTYSFFILIPLTSYIVKSIFSLPYNQRSLSLLSLNRSYLQEFLRQSQLFFFNAIVSSLWEVRSGTPTTAAGNRDAFIYQTRPSAECALRISGQTGLTARVHRLCFGITYSLARSLARSFSLRERRKHDN